MELFEFVRPEAIKIVNTVTSKKRLFQDIGELANTAYGVPLNEAVEALLERESLGPTGVGNGIAFPHARLPGLTQVVGVFIRLEKPVEFEAVDRQPVDLVLALFAPTDSGVEHLKALALVSRTLRDQATCTKLRANVDAPTLHALLTELKTSEAA